MCSPFGKRWLSTWLDNLSYWSCGGGYPYDPYNPRWPGYGYQRWPGWEDLGPLRLRNGGRTRGFHDPWPKKRSRANPKID
jgi:hypothetical protein